VATKLLELIAVFRWTCVVYLVRELCTY